VALQAQRVDLLHQLDDLGARIEVTFIYALELPSCNHLLSMYLYIYIYILFIIITCYS
jgi:hypothetical protein